MTLRLYSIKQAESNYSPVTSYLLLLPDAIDCCRLISRMKVVGLTGGIATGKSTATTFFRRHGVPVIDCDEIAHAITEKASTQPQC